MLGIGVMSGTSLDGIDAALVDVRPQDNGYDARVLRFATLPFPDGLREDLLSLMPPNAAHAGDFARVHQELGLAFASAAEHVRGDASIDYVASHGQTIFHDGQTHRTWQIGDPFILRERLGVSICYDFRSGDTASSGHGAPLVPYVDWLLLRSNKEPRVVVNIGGIANVTSLPPAAQREEVLAFDAGPGVMLLDAFIHERTDGARSYDHDGQLASRGVVQTHALAAMLGHPYFSRPAPKTTGREQFGEEFRSTYDAVLRRLTLEDGCATLAALTATVLTDAIHRYAPGATRVICSGGGIHHAPLMQMLQERLGDMSVETTLAFGIDPDAKEALAFAVLGYETLRGRAANIPGATGAQRAVPLGAIAPLNFAALRKKMEIECRE